MKTNPMKPEAEGSLGHWEGLQGNCLGKPASLFLRIQAPPGLG